MSVEMDEEPNRNNSAPLLLSASVEITQGRTANPDAALLASPYRKPYVIDEIRFQADIESESGEVQDYPVFNMGGNLRCRLQLGRYALTKDFVPIWLFGTAMNSEYVQDALTTSVLNVIDNFSHFRWRLPRPLYVPAGQQLIASFSRTLDGNERPATARIAYAGRYLPPNAPVPKEIDVPYVSSYISDPTTAGQRMTGQSGSLDLVNPFDGPLNVQRMIGRLQYNLADLIYHSYGEATSDLSSSVGGDEVTVIMKDSYGHNIVSDFAPLSEVFSYVRRGWTFHRVLKPRERYHMYWTTSADSFSRTIMASIVGWRKEALK